MLKYPLLAVISVFTLSGCSDTGATITAGGGADLSTGTGSTDGSSKQQQSASDWAWAQEDLVKLAATNPDVAKLSGTIAVKDYKTGILQIDVTLPVEGAKGPPQGVPPITVARFKSPGPFELFLPPKTKAVNLSIFLDLKGNGPDAEDPKATYDKNPIKIDGKSVSGITLVVDKSPSELPSPPPSGSGTGTTTQSTAGTGATAGATAGATTGARTGTGTGIDALSATVGAAKGAGTAAASGTGAPAAKPGTSSTTAPAGSAAATAPSSATGALANPPGVKPAPVKTADPSGKTAADVLDESLDGAPKVAKTQPASK